MARFSFLFSFFCPHMMKLMYIFCAFNLKLILKYNSNERRWSYWYKHRPHLLLQRSIRNFKKKTQGRIKKTRNHGRVIRKKNQTRSEEEKDSEKKSRIQESCSTAYFFIRQARFGLSKSWRRTRSVFLGKKLV